MANKVATISPSWGFHDWPADVWPGNGTRAQRLYRQYSDSLVAAGAVTRIGREVVVFGVAYTRWMQKQANRVKDFDVALNRPQHVHKRRGAHRTEVRS